MRGQYKISIGQNYNFYWPIIGTLYCMTSFFWGAIYVVSGKLLLESTIFREPAATPLDASIEQGAGGSLKYLNRQLRQN